MAINYNPVGWNSSSYYGPTNMNHMDDGIKAACDGVDTLTEEFAGVNESLEDVKNNPFHNRTSVTNIDSIPTSFSVYSTSASTEGTFPNGFSKVGIMIPIRRTSSVIFQVYIDTDNRMATRVLSGGNWGEWDIKVSNNDLEGMRKITFADFEKTYNVPTTEGLLGTVIVASQNCVVTVSVTQAFANAKPKSVSLVSKTADGSNKYRYVTGTDSATLLVPLTAGDYVELYASAETAASNIFKGYVQIVARD